MDFLPVLGARGEEDLSWMWKLGVTMAIVVASLVVATLIRRRHAKRTIEAWKGQGVHPDLGPIEVSVLLGAHPALTVALVVERLLVSGRARIAGTQPLLVDWPDRRPADAVEGALGKAIAPGGEVRSRRVLDLLEVVYDHVNATMEPYSGRATAVHHRRRLRHLWLRLLRDKRVEAGDRPWLLLVESGEHDRSNVLVRSDELWEILRSGTEDAEVIRDAFELSRLFRTQVFLESVLRKRAAKATTGYFVYRDDYRGRPDSRTDYESRS